MLKKILIIATSFFTIWPLAGLTIILLILIGGEFMRVNLGELNFPLTDFLMPLFFAIWIFKKIRFGWQPTQQIKKILIPFSAFTIWALITLLANASFFSTKEILISSFYWIRWVTYASIFFIIADELNLFLLTQKPKNWTSIIQKILLGSFVFAVLIGFLQFYFFTDFEALGLADQGYDPHMNRLAGAWLDPNLAGAFFLIGIIWLTNLILDIFASYNSKLTTYNLQLKIKKLLPITYYLLPTCLLTLALGLTFSRSAYLAFLVACFLIGLIRARKILLIGFLSIILLLTFSSRALERTTDLVQSITTLFSGEDAYFLPDATARLRIQNWEDNLNLVAKQPIFGIGYNTLRFVSRNSSDGHAAGGTDSSLLTILVTTGIPGLILFFWFLETLFLIFWQNWKKFKSTPALTVLISWSAILVHSFFTNSLFFPPILFLLFLFSGLGIASASKKNLPNI